MNQKGLKLTTSSLIDSLIYTYQTGSNKLQQVIDSANDNTSKLGDFKYDAASKTSTDYTYDLNGNMNVDNNKKISSIAYNHLNLPQTITVIGKGIIAYIYDAAGNKLKKITTEGSKITTTLYAFGTYVNDTLQFLPQEEGRIRQKIKPDSTKEFVYDYFLKDHLGNVRVVLTDDVQTDPYPVASLETNTINNEKQYYTIPDDASVRVNKSSVPGYPNDTYTNPNDFIHKLNGNGTKAGSSIVLRL